MSNTQQSKMLPILPTDGAGYISYPERYFDVSHLEHTIVLSMEENKAICGYALDTMSHFARGVLGVRSAFPREPIRIDTARDWFEFQALKEEWYQERNDIVSSEHDIAFSPAYQKIIGMGPRAVRLILSELKRELEQGEPDHWFWALAAITRRNPVPPDSRGKIRKMAEAWINWGNSSDAQTLGTIFF